MVTIGFPDRQPSTARAVDRSLHSQLLVAARIPAIEPECRRRPRPRPRPEEDSMHHHDQRGITTAEYAVGTAAGAGLAGLLFKLLTGGFGERLLRTLFDHVLSLLGIG
jgi:hypothetical protein